MSVVAAMVTVMLLLQCSISAIPAVTDYNPFMYAHGHNCAIQNGTVGTNYFSDYFTAVFPNTLVLAGDVYYSTQSLNAAIVDYPFSHNNSNANLEYYLEVDSITTTSLITRIEGYLVKPLYKLLTFRYLLVSPDTPWLGTYMTIQTLTLTTTVTTKSMMMPTNTSSLTFSVQIRDIKFEYKKNYFAITGSQFYINWRYSLNAVIFTLHLFCPSQWTTTSNNQVRFTVILMNTAAIASAFPGYVFVGKLYLLDVPSSYIPLVFSEAPLHPNLFFGLCLFNITLPSSDPSLYFTTAHSGNEINMDYGGLSIDYIFYIAYAAFPYFVCNDSLYPLFNSTTFTCLSLNCSSTRQYYNHTLKACRPCMYDCLTCNSSLQCLTCNTTYRYLSSNYTCLPLSGYYETNTYIPFSCNSICVTCQDNSSCSSCKPTYYLLTNNTCLACGSYFSPECSVCDQSTCLSCSSGYRLVNASYCNLPCSDSNCLICDNANTTLCFTCKPNHQLNGSLCTFIPTLVSVCGNGKIQSGEVCDDGNMFAWDGCDTTCQQEQDYNCHAYISLVGWNYTTYCAYNQSIQFSPISIEKLDYSNQITIILSVKQFQHKFWTSRMALGYYFLVTPIPYRNMQVKLIESSYYTQHAKLVAPLTAPYYPSSLFSITFEYLQPIEGQAVALCFNFSSSIDLVLSEIPPACYSLAIHPDSNKYANVYSANLYQREKLAYNVCLLLAVASLGLLLVSLVIGGKRIAVEMIIVIQITYVGLITVPKLTPMFAALTALSTVSNGYNLLYSNSMRPFEDVLGDQRAKGVEMYSQFLYNLNSGLIFIIGPILVGVIALIVSRVRKMSEKNTAKLKRFYELALGEYSFVGLAFCGCVAGGSAVLEIRFGVKDIDSQGGLLSLVFCAIFLLLYPLGGVLRVKRGEWFEEYASSLVKGRYSLGFQLVCYILWMLSGVILCAFNSLTYINACITTIFLLLYCSTLIWPIFKRPLDRYRTQLNLLTIAFAQLPYLYANTHPISQNADDDSMNMMAPAIIVILLLINFFTNFVYFVYEGIKKARAYMAAGKIDKNALESEDKQQEKDAMGQEQKFQGKSLIEMKKIQQGFISVTEKDEGQVLMTPTIKKRIKTLLHNDNSIDSSMAITITNMHKTALLQGNYIQSNFEDIDEL